MSIRVDKLKEEVEGSRLSYTKIYENGLIEFPDGYYGYITNKYKVVLNLTGDDKISLRGFICMICDFLNIRKGF